MSIVMFLLICRARRRNFPPQWWMACIQTPQGSLRMFSKSLFWMAQGKLTSSDRGGVLRKNRSSPAREKKYESPAREFFYLGTSAREML